MDKLPTLMLFSAAVLFIAAVAAYVADQTILALALLATAIGDAAIALWLRSRGNG